MATGTIQCKYATWRRMNTGSPATSGTYSLTTSEFDADFCVIVFFRYGISNTIIIDPKHSESSGGSTSYGGRTIEYKYDESTGVLTLVSVSDSTPVYIGIKAVKVA